MYPEKFESVLVDKLALFNHKQGRLLIDTVSTNDLKQDSSLAFANMSLPEKVRFVKVPQLLSDERFRSAIKGLLEATHEEIKKNK